MNIILLASSQPRVGKSYLTRLLLSELDKSIQQSFAVPIKHICYELYENIMSHFGKKPEYTYYEYAQGKKDQPLNDLFTTSPRHQYCEGSEFISSLTSPKIWGQLAAVNILKKEAEGFSTVIFDDWRRLIESEELEKNPNFKVIKVYLDKEGIEQYSGTAATESFEGQLSKDDCDISFMYDSEWSNTNELVQYLKNYIQEISRD